jgi:general secretion pathway protein D
MLSISWLLSAALIASAAAEPAGHTLNLRGADIHALIETVSEITGRGFIVDPGVEGQVTVVSGKPMSEEEVWEAFLAVLRAHGYAAVPAGKLWRISAEPRARAEGPPLAAGSGDELLTRILPLRHLASGEALSLLRPLLPPQVQVAAHPGSNALVVTDRASNIARLEQLLSRLDQASGEEQSEVLTLTHASAGEVVRILSGLYGGEGLRVVADERSNAVVLAGERAVRLRAKALAAHLDLPIAEQAGGTQVVFLRFAEAKDMAGLLLELAKSFGLAGEGGRGVSIQAHPETNALILSAPPAAQQALLAVARQLDVRRAQVLIEAIIVELSDELARELGVQWQSTEVKNTPDGGIGRGVIGGTNFPGPGGAGGILAAAVNPLSVGPGLNVGYVRGTLRLPGSDREILQLGALIRALQAEGRANILATPSVMTLDRHKAVFKAGQEVPFVTGQFINTGGGSNQPQNPFQTIDRKDVGITLTVTPHINEGDMVRLDIVQEVSSLAQQPAGAVDLVTNKRELSTSVIVQDGELLVLGGLISEQVQRNLNKVPALGDIPVLGNLFRYRSTKTERRNLMVFLRPTILRDGAAEAALSTEKYNRIRAEQIRVREREGEGAVLPALPEQDPGEAKREGRSE